MNSNITGSIQCALGNLCFFILGLALHPKAESVATALTEPCLTTFEKIPTSQILPSVPASASWPRAPAPPPWFCCWSQPAPRKSCGCGQAFPSPAWRVANAPALDAGPLSAAHRERTDKQCYIRPMQYFVGVGEWTSMTAMRQRGVKEREHSVQESKKNPFLCIYLIE